MENGAAVTSAGLGVLEQGDLFHGRYAVEQLLAAGGMGAVYEVVDQQTRRRRVLKVMLPALVTNPKLRERFHLEATVAAEVDSDHIVEVLDAGVDEDSGAPFMVMELLRGCDLSERIEKKPLTSSQAVTLAWQVALALDKTHAVGIVHRDLKPENLFLSERDDGSDHVKILDFGIAKVVAESSDPRKTAVLGTPLYMAPEQITSAGIGAATDLYALALIIYEALVGRPYFMTEASEAGNQHALILKLAQGPIERASARAATLGTQLPESFDGWFARAADPEPGNRFDSATDLVSELALALGVEPPARDSSRGRLSHMNESVPPPPKNDEITKRGFAPPMDPTEPSGDWDGLKSPSGTEHIVEPVEPASSAAPFVGLTDAAVSSTTPEPPTNPTPWKWVGVGAVAVAIVAVVVGVMSNPSGEPANNNTAAPDSSSAPSPADSKASDVPAPAATGIGSANTKATTVASATAATPTSSASSLTSSASTSQKRYVPPPLRPTSPPSRPTSVPKPEPTKPPAGPVGSGMF